ncbi:LysR family transcriptional regulator [Thalassolituus sp. LLYu03]|uniref:LysR family transcriptional regulator n=1 Tax=Thalassolituus sp. LLYu03 TaxID=3421656 RepID=UPI003D2E2B25
MKTTLEQWRMFKAVVDHGGYAQAAEAIHKSQSTISYGVHKLQEQLGVQLLEVEGRKAVLTEHGRLLLQRADQLLDQAEHLDKVANSLSRGVEPLVRVAIDTIYPNDMLFDVFETFSAQFPDTRIDLEEFVLSGGNEMLEEDTIDILVTPQIPKGWHGEHIYRARFLPVSTPDHPLQTLNRPLTYDDLTQHRQLVLRDSSKKRASSGGWLGSHQRWTVTHTSTRYNIVRRGLGFSWLPDNMIADDLRDGRLKVLPLEPDGTRFVDLYLVEAHPQTAGPATKALARLLANRCADCPHADGG